jgi:hypothetical protein
MEALFFYLKVVFQGVSVFLILVLVFLVWRYSQAQKAVWQRYMGGREIQEEQERMRQQELSEIQQAWNLICEQVDKGGISELKLGVIEVDRLLDRTLKFQGIGGQDMGERLKEAQRQGISRIDRAWNVHRVRNRLVHGGGEGIGEEKLKRALQEAERVLRGWNLI